MKLQCSKEIKKVPLDFIKKPIWDFMIWNLNFAVQKLGVPE